MALAWLDDFDSPQAAFEDAETRVGELVARLQAPETGNEFSHMNVASTGGDPPEYTSNMTRESFGKAVKDCIEYIHAGDIFQVVLSQRLALDIECDPLEIYRSLRVLNPSPFMFFLRSEKCTLVGSSPEIMCRVVDGEVTVRPLAGTRKRGATPEEDKRLEEELLADEKERAEHVMLVDLGRNDVGRVAKYGSIELPDIMIVERLSLIHI